MSRNDPGAADGTSVYPSDPPCVCGCGRDLHDIGRRGDQSVRTGCSTSGCACTRYEAAVPARGDSGPPRCRTCGTAWDPIEAARLESP